MWSNFHTHSRFCDGKGELVDYCRMAEKAGLISLGFSSHAPLPFSSNWSMKPENFSEYLKTIDQLRLEYPRLNLYKGLEIDFIPEKISVLDFDDQIDYSIGSVHFVDHFHDGRPWEIDGPHNFFMQGLKAIFDLDIRSAVGRYFALTRQMISAASPTIIGHLDKIKIQNIEEKFFKETDEWYQDEVKKTIDVIQHAGCIVEVNTRGLYQKKSMTPYPSPWILELLLERNIPVTLSSDAHHPDDLVNRFSETAFLLRSLGFTRISTLKNGAWQPVAFSENGIALEPSWI